MLSLVMTKFSSALGISLPVSLAVPVGSRKYPPTASWIFLAGVEQPQHYEQGHHGGDEVGVGYFPGAAVADLLLDDDDWFYRGHSRLLSLLLSLHCRLTAICMLRRVPPSLCRGLSCRRFGTARSGGIAAVLDVILQLLEGWAHVAGDGAASKFDG
jgi:hypothetical protein